MEEIIDDLTWFARLSRRMQKDLIDCLDIPFQGYFEIQATDAARARVFWLACQPK